MNTANCKRTHSKQDAHRHPLTFYSPATLTFDLLLPNPTAKPRILTVIILPKSYRSFILVWVIARTIVLNLFWLKYSETRNSAIADKPRDTYRGQSRSPNMVPLHMLGMVSYSVPKTRRFQIFDFKNVVTLKTGLRVREGHWKCHR